MNENENENVNNPEEQEDFDELDNVIVLNDEDGNEVEFEFLDVVELDGKEYVVLLPVEEAERVFKEFKERTKDTFDFVEE